METAEKMGPLDTEIIWEWIAADDAEGTAEDAEATEEEAEADAEATWVVYVTANTAEDKGLLDTEGTREEAGAKHRGDMRPLDSEATAEEAGADADFDPDLRAPDGIA